MHDAGRGGDLLEVIGWGASQTPIGLSIYSAQPSLTCVGSLTAFLRLLGSIDCPQPQFEALDAAKAVADGPFSSWPSAPMAQQLMVLMDVPERLKLLGCVHQDARFGMPRVLNND